MRHHLIAAAILAALASTAAHADDLYFDYNVNYQYGYGTQASVFLFGNAGQSVSVSSLAGFNQSVTLGGTGFYNLPISYTYQQQGTGVVNTGFHVSSADPVAGYFVNRASATTDMTYLLSGSALGTDYVVASMGGSYGDGSQVAIHATQNNTAVTFTPKAGLPISVTLQAGETYKYSGGGNDLTGSTVSASAPVAVFGGAACVAINGGACDTLLEQMIPNDRLSSNYYIAASKNAANANSGDLIRVIATQNGTQVSVNGSTVATLAAGDYYEYYVTDNNGSQVSASNPVMVAQYLTGGNSNTDPAMSLLPGSDTWLNWYRLSTPSGAQAFDYNYASLVIPTTALGSLTLDGSSVNTAGCSVIGSSSFSRCNVDLPLGLFALSASSPFQVLLGGGSFYDSYLTYGGATFSVGVSPPPPPTNDVPEPASMALLGVGLAGLGALRRRRG